MFEKTTMTLCLCVLVAPALTGASAVNRTFTESFDVGPGTKLKLIHGDGDVDIEPSTDDRIDISVRYHLESRGIGVARDFEVDFDRSGDTITVEGREIGDGVFFGGMRTYEYRYTVQAPPYVTLELVGDDGDVAISDWEADVTLRGEDGDVSIDGLRGDLDARLDDGDVDLYDCETGSAQLELADGDVTLRGGSGAWNITVDDGDLELNDLAASQVVIRSEDGDVDLGLLPASALDVDIRTDDGDVVLEVPTGASAHFTFRVDDGSISLRAADAVVESKSEHQTTGVLGAGEGEIRIETEDGDIVLRGGGEPPRRREQSG